MDLSAGKVAVVTGAASGIGLALAERFAHAGLDVVLADVEQPALQAAEQKVAGLGARTLAVPTDASDQAAVNALAAAAVDRFGAVHVVCNNAGVTTDADPWFGPISAWRWVLGVNLWGVIHGIRAFLPLLAAQRESYIVNTASAAGLIPATRPAYDATKHAVVAISEDLYRAMKVAGLPIGVSVLCPGWVRTGIYQAKRNWPESLGEVPPPAATERSHYSARSARNRRRDGTCRRGRARGGSHRRRPVLGVHRPSFHRDGARPMAGYRRRPQSPD